MGDLAQFACFHESKSNMCHHFFDELHAPTRVVVDPVQDSLVDDFFRADCQVVLRHEPDYLLGAKAKELFFEENVTFELTKETFK